MLDDEIAEIASRDTQCEQCAYDKKMLDDAGAHEKIRRYQNAHSKDDV